MNDRCVLCGNAGHYSQHCPNEGRKPIGKAKAGTIERDDDGAIVGVQFTEQFKEYVASVTEGRKFDSDKPRWELLPLGPIEAIVEVLTHGAAKPGYGDFNWQKLKDLEERYYAAMMRHIAARRAGEILDKDSGLPHWAHMLCCGIFLLWKEQQEKEA